MTPDQTITISCDYFIEIDDDGRTDGPEPAVIVLPPQPQGAVPDTAPGAAGST